MPHWTDFVKAKYERACGAALTESDPMPSAPHKKAKGTVSGSQQQWH